MGYIFLVQTLLAFAILLTIFHVDGFRRMSGSALKSFSLFRDLTLRMATIDNTQQTVYDEVKKRIKSKMEGKVPEPSISAMMDSFLEEYASSSIEANNPPELFESNIGNFFKGIIESLVSPYQFQPFHTSLRTPFDYYQWGNDFFRTLIIKEQSRLVGKENAQKILEITNKGENVVILSNHQTEADPQVLSILLEEEGLGEVAEKMIFIAGHKVTNDPVAIPFSMGRNLLCIHSKKHIANPPEKKAEKQAQNMKTVTAMSELAAEGGKIFWVAPSGGRDRPDPESEDGEFVVAPFEVKALDMFKMIAIQTKKPLHFFPMAMYTHQLVPPPKAVSSSLGEERSAKRGAVSVCFLDETEGLGGLKDKQFCKDVQTAVDKAYLDLCTWHGQNK